MRINQPIFIPLSAGIFIQTRIKNTTKNICSKKIKKSGIINMESDNHYINRCQALGKQAAEKGNQPVGAVITRDDKMVSEAEETAAIKNDITCHAELEAIRLAVQQLKTNDLSDCVLYSTHEPCIMCAYAIRYYKIKKVVYQNKVSYLGGVSSSMPLLTTNEVPPHWGNAPVIIYVDANT